MEQALEFSQRVAFDLGALYSRFGYRKYKMSKFEEYDLYARNKDFLISDSVITFTDLSGKLMALKPDVTLSIVKNSKDTPDTAQKLYYQENVYRAAKGSHGFKEIMQVGLECLGCIDDYCIAEILTLACESLTSISPNAILDVSHLGLLTQVLDSMGIPQEKTPQMIQFISEKNLHELTQNCRTLGIPQEKIDLLRKIVSTSGAPDAVLPELETLLPGLVKAETLNQFTTVIRSLEQDLVRIDFSVVDDLHYYNGFVFKGFIQGLPGSVLSGGQYDRLMKKMKRSSGAMGFAVYMDLLERLEPDSNAYDVDTVLLYDSAASLSLVAQHAAALRAVGNSVMVQQTLPEGIRCRQVLKITNSEVTPVEYA